MEILRNKILHGSNGKPILWDAFWISTALPKELVVFVHGFKGFKDWGCWDLVAKRFAEAGFVFVKFNFSHNGTTPEDPIAFGDLEAFGQNNYSKEQKDLGLVIDFLTSAQSLIPSAELNTKQLHLVGHSRGGGAVLLKAAADQRVSKVSAWAAISSTNRSWTEEQVQKWKEDGVAYVMNGRTKQNMPLYYQLYEDFVQNQQQLNIEQAVKTMKQDLHIVHGTDDPAVPFTAALEIQSWKPSASLLKIEGANHVFGGKHPWLAEELPTDLKRVVDETVRFFKA